MKCVSLDPALSTQCTLIDIVVLIPGCAPVIFYRFVLLGGSVSMLGCHLAGVRLLGASAADEILSDLFYDETGLSLRFEHKKLPEAEMVNRIHRR